MLFHTVSGFACISRVGDTLSAHQQQSFPHALKYADEERGFQFLCQYDSVILGSLSLMFRKNSQSNQRDYPLAPIPSSDYFQLVMGVRS